MAQALPTLHTARRQLRTLSRDGDYEGTHAARNRTPLHKLCKRGRVGPRRGTGGRRRAGGGQYTARVGRPEGTCMNDYLSILVYALVVGFTVSTLAAGLWLLWIWRDVTIRRVLQLARQERQRRLHETHT